MALFNRDCQPVAHGASRPIRFLKSRYGAGVTAFLSVMGLMTAPAFAAPEEWKWLESLATKLTRHADGSSPGNWNVEYLGDRREYAKGDNWEFRATHRVNGTVKKFRSGTQGGYFIGAFTYGPVALIAADLGSGVWGFTVYDVDEERNVVEFWAAFPHLSPDGRYLLYRKFNGRRRPPDPGVVVLDLSQEFGEVEIGTPSQGFGETVFPHPPPPERPELGDAYLKDYAGWYGIEHVAWDMENATVYFPAQNRTGLLSLVAVRLEPAPAMVCQVPLAPRTLRGEYFEELRMSPTGIELRSADTIVVSTGNSLYVTAEYSVPLYLPCWKFRHEVSR